MCPLSCCLYLRVNFKASFCRGGGLENNASRFDHAFDDVIVFDCREEVTDGRCSDVIAECGNLFVFDKFDSGSWCIVILETVDQLQHILWLVEYSLCTLPRVLVVVINLVEVAAEDHQGLELWSCLFDPTDGLEVLRSQSCARFVHHMEGSLQLLITSLR